MLTYAAGEHHLSDSHQVRHRERLDRYADVCWRVLTHAYADAVSIALTVFSSENFTNIAWDSAGVTTGMLTYAGVC
jgi:hypothetical protein